MKPKFNIGDRVKFHRHTDGKAGEVLSYAYVPELETFRYTISAKQNNPDEQRYDNAVRHCLEEELIKEGEKPTKDEVSE